MTDVFDFQAGESPLLISIPHDGRKLMPGQPARMTRVGLELPDTDWHVRLLYDFTRELGAGMLAANFSRYVVDLNRPANDAALYAGQVATGLCPQQTFAGEAIYRHGGVSADEQSIRIRDYWNPYHERLDSELCEIKARFGYALLWDAHSIAGRVPLLFGGTLPDLNIGTNDGLSAAATLTAPVVSVAERSPYSCVLNGRFKGGYITRHYGNPAKNVHAIQLELVQANYMDENTREFDTRRANKLRTTIRAMLQAFETGLVGRK